MRLENEIIKKIIKYAKEHFGDDIKLYLFGSRTKDNKKGGDIDLFLEINKDMRDYENMEKELNFLRDIYKNVTQRKVDLLIKTPFSKDRSIFESAKEDGVLLC